MSSRISGTANKDGEPKDLTELEEAELLRDDDPKDAMEIDELPEYESESDERLPAVKSKVVKRVSPVKCVNLSRRDVHQPSSSNSRCLSGRVQRSSSCHHYCSGRKTRTFANRVGDRVFRLTEIYRTQNSSGRSIPICMLCLRAGHVSKFCRMKEETRSSNCEKFDDAKCNCCH